MTTLTPLSFSTSSFGPVTIQFESYAHGDGMAVELYDAAGEYVMTLSVNLPEFSARLGPGEFFAKTWSENDEIAKEALASGLFLDTGRSVQVNWIVAPVWKLRRTSSE